MLSLLRAYSTGYEAQYNALLLVTYSVHLLLKLCVDVCFWYLWVFLCAPFLYFGLTGIERVLELWFDICACFMSLLYFDILLCVFYFEIYKFCTVNKNNYITHVLSTNIKPSRHYSDGK